MSEQPEAFQLAAELERTDSPLRRPDTVALRAAELLRQQWQDIQHACAAERERAIEHARAVGEKVLLIREQHAEIERLRIYLHNIKFQAELARDYIIQLNDDCDAAMKEGKP